MRCEVLYIFPSIDVETCSLPDKEERKRVLLAYTGISKDNSHELEMELPQVA